MNGKRQLLCLLISALLFSVAAAEIEVVDVSVSPESVYVGENVTITATVKNTRNATENATINFKVNGEVVKSVNVTLDANETKTLECMVTAENIGNFTVNVGNRTAYFEVLPIPSPTPSPTPTPTATPSPTPSPSPSPMPSPTPSPTQSPTPTPTPTPSPAPPTPTATTTAPTGGEKFRVGPVVKLRPLNDVACPGEDGLIELYMSNPSLNDVTLTVEVWVEIPSGIHVSGEGFAVDTAAGVAHALFEVTPGTSKTVHVNIKPIGSYEEREVFIHAYGYYWPGQNKDNSYPISLTHPFKIRKTCPPTPTPPSTPTPPGFEAIFAIAVILLAAYLVIRRK